MRVLLYGRLADALGSAIELDAADGCSIAELRQRLAADYPLAADRLGSGRTRACIEGVLVKDDHVIAARDRVEFLPPVSGG